MFRLLLVALIVALACYYAMVVLHYVKGPIFGKTPVSKLLIPFYGWGYLFKNQNKEQKHES